MALLIMKNSGLVNGKVIYIIVMGSKHEKGMHFDKSATYVIMLFQIICADTL